MIIDDCSKGKRNPVKINEQIKYIAEDNRACN